VQIARDKVNHPSRYTLLTDGQHKLLHCWGLAMMEKAGGHPDDSNVVCLDTGLAWSVLVPSRKAGLHDLVMWLANERAKGHCIPVFLDYAGVESPWHAAQELGIPLHHVASCDRACGPQKYIMRNMLAEHFFTNVFSRSESTMRQLCVGAAPPPPAGAVCSDLAR